MNRWRRVAGLLMGAWVTAGATWAQAEVTPTMESIFVFDSQGGTTFMGAPVPVGAVIDAYDPEGIHCGNITVGSMGDTAGYFALMSVYRDDPGDPDEGAVYGDEIAFTINGHPAEVVRGGPVIWTGNGVMYDISLSVPDLVTAVAADRQGQSAVPTRLELQPNYPNPFNSTTTIACRLPVGSEVTVSVHNLAGQQVATLARGWRLAGAHTVHWDGRDASGRELAGGVYLYRVRAGAQVETRKLVLLQ